MVRANDGHFYVVKSISSVDRNNGLFNEVAGYKIFRRIGLPVPEWRPMLITQSFLDETQALRERDGAIGKRLEPGVWFASRFAGRSDDTVFEVLPGSWIAQVKKRTNFWLAWIADICAAHTDNRQAVFARGGDGTVVTYFIDHDNLLGGRTGCEEPHFRASRYLDGRVYDRLTDDRISAILASTTEMNVDGLWREMRDIPQEWQSSMAFHALGSCLERLASADFVLDALHLAASNSRPIEVLETVSPMPQKLVRAG